MLGQSRVNEIVNGRRQVHRLDVLERIADGLGMPDESRAEFGLAPQFPDREIVQVFPSQQQAAEEIRQATLSAAHIDVLAVRGLGLIGLNNSLLRASLEERPETRMRVLLLEPGCRAAERRAKEIGESAEQMNGGIRTTEAGLRTLAERGAQVELYWYTTLPVWRVFAVDNILYLSSFDVNWEGHESEITKVAPSPRGPIYHGVTRMLTELFRTSERVI